MPTLIWTTVGDGRLGPVEYRQARWFDDRVAAERWAKNALTLDVSWRIDDRPGALAWWPVKDLAWAANHRQKTYVITREAAVWSSAVDCYEFAYYVEVDGEEVCEAPGLRRRFRSLDGAMARCDELAFGSENGEAK